MNSRTRHRLAMLGQPSVWAKLVGSVAGRSSGETKAAPPRFRRRPALTLAGRLATASLLLIAAGVAFGLAKGWTAVYQTSVNGLVTGSYLALGAIGLTFVYGILRLVNFAHGDFLTFGAYMALLLNVGAQIPLVASILFAMAATAVLSVLLELGLWRPLRRRGAAGLQLMLATIGLAYILRYGLQFVAGPDEQQLRVNVTSSVAIGGGAHIGRTILISALVAYAVITAVTLGLRFSRPGKQIRALADSIELAETTGLNTSNLIVGTWVVGGALAGLAGTLYVMSVGAFDPQFGFTLLLPLFAAVLVGGVGSPYGAIAGGIVLGLAEEWSTLFINPDWQIVVAFGVLIATLLIRPEGIFAPAGRV